MTGVTTGTMSMRRTRMTTDIPQEAVELDKLIRQLSLIHRQHLEPALERLIKSLERRRPILDLVQEALSQLRLDMKYLMFDLEATRRERDDARRRAGK
jgi:hypothetical protein